MSPLNWLPSNRESYSSVVWFVSSSLSNMSSRSSAVKICSSAVFFSSAIFIFFKLWLKSSSRKFPFLSTFSESWFERFSTLMSPLNWRPSNIWLMSVTLDTFHWLMSPLKSLLLNIPLMFVTLDTFHWLMSPLNKLLLNIILMFVTLATFHLLMSPLKLLPLNNSLISVMPETSMSFRLHSGPSV